MATSYVAWSDLYFGGEVELRDRPGGGTYKVIKSRNRLARGEKVTKSKLGVSDEEWDALIESGSVRPYDLPPGADNYTSPTRAVLAAITNDRGDIDADVLLQLALQHPVVGAVAEVEDDDTAHEEVEET